MPGAKGRRRLLGTDLMMPLGKVYRAFWDLSRTLAFTWSEVLSSRMMSLNHGNHGKHQRR